MALSRSKEYKKKAEEFLKNRKNANNLVELAADLDDPASAYISNVLAIDLVFSKLLSRGDLSPQILSSEDSVEIEYRNWLKENYDLCFSKLLQLVIKGQKHTLQVETLSVIFKLIAAEGKYPVDDGINPKQYYFPIHRLQQLYSAFLSSDRSIKKLLPKLEEMFSSFLDVVYFSWMALAGAVSAVKNPSEVAVKNILLLIDQLPTAKTEEKELEKASKENLDENLLCFIRGKKKFKADMDVLRTSVTKVWWTIKNWPHTPATKLRLLTVLNERILHNLEKPLTLADFLTDSLDDGGPVSVLALQAIFVLIVKHNFDCSKIFKKLYALFEPNIFHTKYKARLFHLSNICFSSTHLQENLVASFIKRLARLSLTAPAADVIIIAAFIGNLIIRHPTLKSLIHGSSRY
ncbi:unnamed protein product [Bemisia tabaci]|uniref:CCAAT-binding factor domain-containing protein n=1 Tax=Bemisia tabaci TaxID=7038 RepID=A0A9P0F231_BEMTA|nr:unnamed protein product [Bemisia tabaci]